MTASGNRPRSAKKAKISSQPIFYTLDHSTRLLHLQRAYIHVQELQYRKPARAARGEGRVMEVPILNGGGGGRNSEAVRDGTL